MDVQRDISEKNTLSQQLEAKLKQLDTAWLLTFALHMKRGGFKIKTVLIIVFHWKFFFNNLYTFCHLSSDPFM